eukprot:UN01872
MSFSLMFDFFYHSVFSNSFFTFINVRWRFIILNWTSKVTIRYTTAKSADMIFNIHSFRKITNTIS